MANADIKKGKQKYLFIAGKGEKCGVTIEIIVMIPQNLEVIVLNEPFVSFLGIFLKH